MQIQAFLKSKQDKQCSFQYQRNNRLMRKRQLEITPPAKQIPSYQHPSMCVEHNQPLQFVNFTSNYRPLCAQCISSNSYHNHDIKNLDRSRQLLTSICEQWKIRLSSKSQILDVIHQQLQGNKAQVSAACKNYKHAIKCWMLQLSEMIKQKSQQMMDFMQESVRQYLHSTSDYMQKIRIRRKQIEKMIEKVDRDRFDKLEVLKIAQFCALGNNHVQNLLQEHQIIFFKQQLVQPQWKINSQGFEEIKNTISRLTIYDVNKQKIAKTKLAKKKSKKVLKGQDFEQMKKHRQHRLTDSSHLITPFLAASTPFLAASTPKQQSTEKNIKMAKSPQVNLNKTKKSSGKMISMPASPAKSRDKGSVISPDLSRKKFVKKK